MIKKVEMFQTSNGLLHRTIEEATRVENALTEKPVLDYVIYFDYEVGDIVYYCYDHFVQQCQVLSVTNDRYEGDEHVLLFTTVVLKNLKTLEERSLCSDSLRNEYSLNKIISDVPENLFSF